MLIANKNALFLHYHVSLMFCTTMLLVVVLQYKF